MNRLLAATIVLAAAGGAMEAQATTSGPLPAPESCSASDGQGRAADEANRVAYRQTLTGLQSLTAWRAPTAQASAELADLESAVRHAECLRQHYNRQSGVQQNLVTGGAWASSLSSLGYFAAGGMAETVFGYGAFAPILFTQLSASEPKRDLYSAAEAAVRRMTERYVALVESGERLSTSRVRTRAGDEDFSRACATVRAATLQTRPNTLPDADHNAIQGVASALANQCADLERLDRGLSALNDDYGALRPGLGRLLALDLGDFHHRVQQKHRQLLYTPSESLRVMLASPFRAAANLLEGGGDQATLDQVEAAQTFQGLNHGLRPLAGLLTRPSSTGPLVAVTLDPRVAAAAGPAIPRANVLRNAHASLDARREALNRELRYAAALLEAAERTQLGFTFSTQTGVMELTLDRPALPAA